MRRIGLESEFRGAFGGTVHEPRFRTLMGHAGRIRLFDAELDFRKEGGISGFTTSSV
jgi:hypothetical protein